MKSSRKISCYGLAVLFFLLVTSVATGETLPGDLKFITEQYPPYNFMENGQLKGISMDLLEQITGRLGIALKKKDVSLVPWEEGYQRTLKRKDTLLFSMTRTVEREKKFLWVGPISPTRVVLFTRKDMALHPTSGSALKDLKIGAIRDDIGEQLAVKAGVQKKKLTLSSKTGDLIRLLEDGKIDAWAYEETAGKWFIKHEAANPDNIKVARVLFEGELYYAFNRKTSKVVVTAFQKALEEIKKEKSADGSSPYEKIFDRYLKPRYIQDRISNEQVIRLVDLTTVALAADAPATMKKINAGEHPYRNRENHEMYVFVYDTDINMTAHGDNATLVGKNFRGKTDVEGKAFRDAIVAGALSNGSGWEDYIYTSPKQSGLYYKTTYYKLVKGSDGKTYIVCAGKFKDQP